MQGVEKQFSLDKDENGFYTLKDLHSGREISFDEIPDDTDHTLQRTAQQCFPQKPIPLVLLCLLSGTYGSAVDDLETCILSITANKGRMHDASCLFYYCSFGS